jgi:NADH dehydrogenase
MTTQTPIPTTPIDVDRTRPAMAGEAPVPIRTRPARGGVLIVGGGFAGATLARRIGRRGATVVNPENHMLYTSLLPDVAAGTVEPRHVVVPIRQMAPHADLVLGRAVALDQARREVLVETDVGPVAITYEQLIVAAGGVTRALPIPGLAEHALGFKTLADAVHARNTILRRLDDADEADPADRERWLTFVFVGGGYAGVEGIAQLHELAQHALRHYPALRGARQRWVLVDASPRILTSASERLARYAARALGRRGIEIRSDTHLVAAGPGQVLLSDGERIATETLVWAAGVLPSTLGARFGLPVDDRGRIIVGPTLQVEGRERIWALGDVARVPNAATGGPDPAMSQHALRQAHRLARNLRAVADGRPPRAYAYRTIGEAATLGRHRAITEVMGIPLTGFPAWLAARAYHLMRLPLATRRLRLLADWTAATLLSRDITQLGSLGHGEPIRPRTD